MPGQSELYKSVFALDEKLHRSIEGKLGSSGKLRQLRLSLLQVLELAQIDSLLVKAAGRVHGGKTLLNTIRKRVEAKEFAVLRAIYDHAHMGAGMKSACSRWGCTPSDVKAAIELAKNLGRPLGLFMDEIPPLDLGCLADVRAAHEEVVVHLSHRALEDMLLATLEGYQVPKTTKSRFTEVYGLCIGMVRNERLRRKGGGKYYRKYVYVQQAPAQLRARATKDNVWPNPLSLESQLGAAKARFPHLEVIGDFHSHLYKNARNLRHAKGWEPSKTDGDSNREWVKTMQKNGHDPIVAFIIAIGKQKRSWASKKKVSNPNARFLMIGNNLIGVSVYRILPDATYEVKGVELRIPDLPGGS